MPLLVAALLVAADQLSKAWVVATYALGASSPTALGFSITHSRNNGAAFGLLRDVSVPLGPLTIDATFLLGVLSLAVSAVLGVYVWRARRRLTTLTGTALGLILAGAIGNMIDRFRLGYVIDFIHFKVGWFDFPVFNIADSCVVVGAGLLILASMAGHEGAP